MQYCHLLFHVHLFSFITFVCYFVLLLYLLWLYSFIILAILSSPFTCCPAFFIHYFCLFLCFAIIFCMVIQFNNICYTIIFFSCYPFFSFIAFACLMFLNFAIIFCRTIQFNNINNYCHLLLYAVHFFHSITFACSPFCYYILYDFSFNIHGLFIDFCMLSSFFFIDYFCHSFQGLVSTFVV